ncbi:hypothetical protein BDW72DRAFT_86962 [Aspergillus terricola var. indicus]
MGDLYSGDHRSTNVSTTGHCQLRVQFFSAKRALLLLLLLLGVSWGLRLELN